MFKRYKNCLFWSLLWVLYSYEILSMKLIFFSCSSVLCQFNYLGRPKNLEVEKGSVFYPYTSIHSHEQFMILVKCSYAFSLCKAKQYIVFLCVWAFIVKLEIFQGEWILSNFIAWNLMIFILLLNKSYLLVRKLWKGQCVWIIISSLNAKSFPEVQRVVDTCWRWSLFHVVFSEFLFTIF